MVFERLLSLAATTCLIGAFAGSVLACSAAAADDESVQGENAATAAAPAPTPGACLNNAVACETTRAAQPNPGYTLMDCRSQADFQAGKCRLVDKYTVRVTKKPRDTASHWCDFDETYDTMAECTAALAAYKAAGTPTCAPKPAVQLCHEFDTIIPGLFGDTRRHDASLETQDWYSGQQCIRGRTGIDFFTPSGFSTAKSQCDARRQAFINRGYYALPFD